MKLRCYFNYDGRQEGTQQMFNSWDPAKQQSCFWSFCMGWEHLETIRKHPCGCSMFSDIVGEHRPLPFSRDATNPVCLLLHQPETYFFNTFSLWQEGAAIREPKRNMFNKNGYKLNVCCESASAFERSKMDIYLSGKSHNSNQSALPTAQSFLCWRCHMSPLLMLVPTAHWEWWKDYLIRCTSKPSSISCVGCSSQVNIVIDWIEKNNIFEHFTVSRSSTTALCAGHAVHPRRTSGRNQTTGIQCLTSIQCCCFL